MKKTFDPIHYLVLLQRENEVFYSFQRNIFHYRINSNKTFDKLNEIPFDDEVMSLNLMKNGNLLIVGVNNKKMIEMASDGILNTFVHSKKITNVIYFHEEPGMNDQSSENDKPFTDFVLFSDKFGEISIKTLNEFQEKPKIIYGHSDPIHFLTISPKKRHLLLSADHFGKIKICEFPNVFNLLTVLVYKNEDILFCDFINDETIIILDSANEIHLWSSQDFELKAKLKFVELQDIISVYPFKEKYLFINTANMYIIFEVDSSYTLIKRLSLVKKDEMGCKIGLPLWDEEKENVCLVQIEQSGAIQNIIENVLS